MNLHYVSLDGECHGMSHLCLSGVASGPLTFLAVDIDGLPQYCCVDTCGQHLGTDPYLEGINMPRPICSWEH
jgi:hypothetical protein